MNREQWLFTGATVAILAIVLAAAWYGAGVEAATYERLTGNEVTQWEALWVNLRVDCN